MQWTVHLEGGPRRVNHAAVAVNETIYSFGGYCTGERYKSSRSIDVHLLNTLSYRWILLPTPEDDDQKGMLPFQRYGHTAVGYKNMIYIWGGRNDNAACNVLYKFNTLTLKWSKPDVSGKIPGARDGHAACVIGHTMYVFGGFEDEINRFSVDVHTLDLKTMEWSLLGVERDNTVPKFTDFHTATAIGNRMYVFGGRGDENAPFHSQREIYCNKIMYLDTTDNTWYEPKTTGTAPVGRRSHSAFAYNDRLYIFGGFNGICDEHYNDLHCFDTGRNNWQLVATNGEKPCKRRRQSCIVVGHRMFLFGGTSPKFYTPHFDETALMDHNDMFILDFAPTLLTLALLAVLKSEPAQKLPEWLPQSIRWNAANMTTNNTITLPLKEEAT